MISLLASIALARPHIGIFRPQDTNAVLLAAAMVRHQEPVGKGVRATVAEIYPIAWESRGQWFNASTDSKEVTASSAVQAGDRFEIYKNGWQVGWFDVNRIAPKPYVSNTKLVGLGGWSLPRALYPYRLDRATNLNYLYQSIYDWGNNKYKNSVQPFLALNTERPSLSSTDFSPAQMKRDIYPVVEENVRHILHQVAPLLTMRDLHLKTYKAYDLDGDRVPEVFVTYNLPSSNGNTKTLTVVATVEASAFMERYRSVDENTDWQPFDVIDVDGDNYKEIVLIGRDNGKVSFRVLHGTGGRMKQVFEGASFGA